MSIRNQVSSLLTGLTTRITSSTAKRSVVLIPVENSLYLRMGLVILGLLIWLLWSKNLSPTMQNWIGNFFVILCAWVLGSWIMSLKPLITHFRNKSSKNVANDGLGWDSAVSQAPLPNSAFVT